MERIFVIGSGNEQMVRKVLELKDSVEVVCVNSIEDIPLNERFSSDPAKIQQIHQFIERPKLQDVNFYDTDKKRKGHERPYKFHKIIFYY